MRLKFDSAGYVCCVLYGCTTDGCVEYEGTVPTEPEEYADIDDWADRAQVQAYKLDASRNLVYDANRAATLPNPDSVEAVPYTAEQVRALGIIDAIYPVGSLYMSVNDVNPATIFGGTWEQIKDKFILSAGDSYSGGSTGGASSHKHVSPVGYNSSNKLLGISYAQGSQTLNATGTYATPSQTVSTGSGTYSWTLPSTASASSLPPYLAVFVWKRVS